MKRACLLHCILALLLPALAAAPAAWPDTPATPPKKKFRKLRSPLKALPKPTRPVKEAPLIREPEAAVPPAKYPTELEAPLPKHPFPVSLLMGSLRNGMFIRLPIVDTNPNRGFTYGVMPILVLHGKDETRIRHIHAPSVTHNKTFGFVPTYRYYYYPTTKANYQARASISKAEDREAMLQFEDMDFLGRDIAATAKVQYDVDGSKRFYGIGPDSPRGAESNFTRKTALYNFRLGLPILPESGLRFNFAHQLAGVRLAAGVIDDLPDIGVSFPEVTPDHWHQDAEFQLYIDYDTRDEAVTTSRGVYAKIMIENSQTDWGSEYAFQRYGTDLRAFWKPDPAAKHATAARLRYEQIIGDAPFHLMPSLGGKKLHRAYGDGRYIDKGMWTASLEERVTVYRVGVSGVSTDIELAPFVELGTVFSTPKRMASRYCRPVYGIAVRAVARPQVVGSIDLGWGQEGSNVFMDINYSF
ncbi:MAG: hypothetical protein A2X36_06080 [Elusimicrobia bacterium GWA2_69_24]|nr:MAG: hypothetical protein A2X36_06080 [Elusimicrobia bacterium GWA2_69_24]HBL18229.1 hypothetical protein [Elusimicrobiota bacterium]